MKRSRLIAGGGALLVAAIAVIAVATTGGASGTKSSSATASSAPGPSFSMPTTQPPTTAPPTTAPAPMPVPAGASVRVAHDAILGDLLVAGNGHTVYEFDKDQGIVSACSGSCAVNWPVWMTAGPPVAGPGVNASMLASAHGQVTYAGHLLYFFAGDQIAGQTNGAGIPGFHAISPAGMLVGR